MEGQQHIVEMKLHPISGAGEILVDGKVVRAWPGVPHITHGRDRKRARIESGRWQTWEFEVAGKPAILQPGGFLGRFTLYVDGQKVK